VSTREDGRHHLSHPEAAREVFILGCRVDALTFQQTMQEVDRLIQAGGPVQHCVVNASKIVMMRKELRLKGIVSSCPLVNADGQSIVWAARALGAPLPERVTGIDLFLGLLRLAEARGYGVYFVGARDDVVNAVVSRARREHPRLRVCGWHDGYVRASADDVAGMVCETRPDILFVGMPSPMKEYWLADNLARMAVPFSMGVGGSFDVYAGRVSRAPLWMQRSGLEWAYRFWQEPRRMWRRYLVGNVEFVILVVDELLAGVRRRRLGGGRSRDSGGAGGFG
jgi:N-acetylglucosaminyldiphosphoundecaprenol N-acetyl-beta-D-mannosaminyltransferase